MTYPNTTGTGNARILDSGISRLAVNAVVAASVMTALALGLAFTRFAIRRKGGWGSDDTVLAVSLVFLVWQLIWQYLLAFWAGEGWSTPDLMMYPEKITRTLQMIYFPSLTYGIVSGLIKTSILLSYLRIFGHLKHIKIYIWVLLGLSWGWALSSIFGMAFQCTPVKKAWMPEMQEGTCIDLIAFLWGNSVSNLIIDWLILSVPIHPVLKLQLATSKKILIFLAFLCGSLACIASTIRAVHTKDFDPTNLGITVYDASVWIYIEPPMGIISSCLPFLSRIWGNKAMKGVKTITNRITTGRGHSKNQSLDDSSKLSKFRELGSSSEDSARSWEYPAEPDTAHIRKTTSTSVQSENANEAQEMSMYQFTVNGTVNTPTNKQSIDSMV